MVVGRLVTGLRGGRFAWALLLVATFIAAGGCREMRESCGCAPSRYENTPSLYQIIHPQATYYGQFYEDYILGYAFEGQKTGFYVDVGANDPNVQNVTRYFYERGWHGVNIEPNAVEFKKLVQYRPRDINYNCGISNAEGVLTFFSASGRQDTLSTFDKADAERLAKQWGVQFTEQAVPVTTLNALLGKMPRLDISFLSIDVEGFERQVIESIDLKKYKPAVLCIEATEPVSETPAYAAWEATVLQGGYVYAMFDGLNRYYVNKSRLDLLPRFIFIDMCVKRSKLHRQIKLNGSTSW